MGKGGSTSTITKSCKIVIQSNSGDIDTHVTEPNETWSQLCQRIIENDFASQPLLLFPLLVQIHPEKRLCTYRLRYGNGYSTIIKPTWHHASSGGGGEGEVAVVADDADHEDHEQAFIDVNVSFRQSTKNNDRVVVPTPTPTTLFSPHQSILSSLGEEGVENTTFVKLHYEKIGGVDDWVGVCPFPVVKERTRVLTCTEDKDIPRCISEFKLEGATTDEGSSSINLPRKCINLRMEGGDYDDQMQVEEMAVISLSQGGNYVTQTQRESNTDKNYFSENRSENSQRKRKRTYGGKRGGEQGVVEKSSTNKSGTSNKKRLAQKTAMLFETVETGTEKKAVPSKVRDEAGRTGMEKKAVSPKVRDVAKKTGVEKQAVTSKASIDSAKSRVNDCGVSKKAVTEKNSVQVPSQKKLKKAQQPESTANDVLHSTEKSTLEKRNTEEETVESKTKPADIDSAKSRRNDSDSSKKAGVEKIHTQVSPQKKHNKAKQSESTASDVLRSTEKSTLEKHHTEQEAVENKTKPADIDSAKPRINDSDLSKKAAAEKSHTQVSSQKKQKKAKKSKSTIISVPRSTDISTLEKRHTEEEPVESNTKPSDPTPEKQKIKQKQQSSVRKSPSYKTGKEDEHVPSEPAGKGFPDGWTLRRFPRSTGNAKDIRYYSPQLNIKFRVKGDALKFLKSVEKADGDETVAIALQKAAKGALKFLKSVEKADGDETVAIALQKAAKGGEGNEEEKSQGELKPATKKKKDPNQPKRPPNGFLLFSKENRPLMKMQNPDLPPKQLTSKIGEAWRGLSEKDAKPYKDKAAEAASKYKVVLKAYERTKLVQQDTKLVAV